MSDVSDTASVYVLLADYAAADSANKLNVIGGGINTAGILPQTGQTAPFSVVASVAVPPGSYNEQASIELVLEYPSGEPVFLPGPAGEGQAMRVAQAVTFNEPTFPAGANVPRRSMRARNQIAITFNFGLPLSPGQKYVWRVKVDGVSRDDWTEEIYVPGPPVGPVVG